MVLPATSERTVCFLLWNTCNARCAHCGPSSGPKDKTRNSRELISRLISEAYELYGNGWTLSLSGGEPFLRYEELKSIVIEAHSKHGYTTLVTNAYWAISREAALAKIIPLVEHGLKIMSISSDVYHDPFIPFKRVATAVEIAQHVGLKVTIRSVGSKVAHASEIMDRLRNHGISYVDVMEMPLVPEGRGAKLPREDFLLSDKFPSGRCPSATMTMDASSNAMVCCNGGGSDPSLQLGNAENLSLLDLEYKFATDPVINFLRNNGPAKAIDFLPERERERFLASRYVNECDLCIRLFEGEQGMDLRKEIEEDFMVKMKSAVEKFMSNVIS